MTDKSKGPSLLDQLKAVSGKTETPAEAAGGRAESKLASRRGKQAITIWVDPLVADQLKEIAFHDKSLSRNFS
jgi:hypothetical protein